MTIEKMAEKDRKTEKPAFHDIPGVIEVDEAAFRIFVEKGLIDVSGDMARYSLDLTKPLDIDTDNPEKSLAEIEIVDPNLYFTPEQTKKDDQALFTASAVALAKARLAKRKATLSEREKKALDKFTDKVLDGAGRFLASKGGKRAVAGATAMVAAISIACNFPLAFQPQPSPTEPWVVETAEPAQTVEPTAEPSPTKEPSPTPTEIPKPSYVFETPEWATETDIKLDFCSDII